MLTGTNHNLRWNIRKCLQKVMCFSWETKLWWLISMGKQGIFEAFVSRLAWSNEGSLWIHSKRYHWKPRQDQITLSFQVSSPFVYVYIKLWFPELNTEFQLCKLFSMHTKIPLIFWQILLNHIDLTAIKINIATKPSLPWSYSCRVGSLYTCVGF